MLAFVRMLFLLLALPFGLQPSVSAQAPVITREPSDLTVVEGCPATFVVEAEGAAPLTFRWFKDGELIPDATDPIFRIPFVPLAYNGATFYVIVSNEFGSAQSRTSTLTILLDVVPPSVTGVRTGNNLQQVIVTFSAGSCGSASPMDPISTSDPYNYFFEEDLDISAAQFIPPNVVVLTTSTQTVGMRYTLNVEGVADQTGNVIQHTEVSFTASVAASPAPRFRWARKVPGGDDDGGYGVASDRNGNFYLTTFLSASATLDGVALTGPGIFVAAYDEDGNLLRAFKGSTEGALSSALAVDSDGNIFVAGGFHGAVSFGSHQLINDHLYRWAPFLAKYSPTGAVLWARRVPEDTIGWASAVATDPEGNSYVAGSAVSENAFVAKYDPQGNRLWMRTVAGTNRAYAVAVDNAGNCIVGGLFSSGAQFGNIALAAGPGVRAFLAKYDTNGSVLWARAEGGDFIWNTIYALAVDQSGNIYAAGNYSGTGAFGSPTAPVGSDAFVAKYDPSGRRLWVRSGGGGLNDIGFSIATDPAGSCYVAGVMQGSARFGDFVLVDPGTEHLEEAFVLKLDANGEFLWAKQAGGARDDYAYAIALNQNGNCFVAGYFETPAQFDALTLTTDSERDSFVAVIAPHQPRLEITRTAGFPLEVSWPIWASHFRLESANALGLWSPANLPIQRGTNRMRANLLPTGPGRFFRLAAP